MSHKQSLETILKFGCGFGYPASQQIWHGKFQTPSLVNLHRINPLSARVIRLCLRAMGGMALAVCVIFWLSLYWQ